jgi:hypothetical protein
MQMSLKIIQSAFNENAEHACNSFVEENYSNEDSDEEDMG